MTFCAGLVIELFLLIRKLDVEAVSDLRHGCMDMVSGKADDLVPRNMPLLVQKSDVGKIYGEHTLVGLVFVIGLG